jgi:hypothetical protein
MKFRLPQSKVLEIKVQNDRNPNYGSHQDRVTKWPGGSSKSSPYLQGPTWSWDDSQKKIPDWIRRHSKLIDGDDAVKEEAEDEGLHYRHPTFRLLNKHLPRKVGKYDQRQR